MNTITIKRAVFALIIVLSMSLTACNSLDKVVDSGNLDLGTTGKTTSCAIYGTACKGK